MTSLSALAGLARSIAIYHGRPWRTAAMRRFYAGLVGPGDLAFDIGAHVGNRSRVLASLGASVVALEPQPLFAAFLARTLPSSVTLRTEAVAAAPGRLTLSISSRHPTVSTLSRRWIDTVSPTDGFGAVTWDRSVEVDVTTLDLLIEAYGRPRFVKIDVEGMEAEILRGLSEAVPVVAVEYLPAALDVAVESIRRLEALGDYRFNRVVGEEHRYSDDWVGAAETIDRLSAATTDGRSGDLYAVLAGDAAAGGRSSSATRPGSPPMTTTTP
jgi:FkbM family methyltransferase